MLPVDHPLAPATYGVLLVGLIAVLVTRAIRKDRREYQRFKRYRTTRRRQALYRKWLIESFAWFGGSALVVLVLVWPYLPLMLEEVDRWPPVRAFHDLLEDGGALAQLLIVGGSLALLAVIILSVFLARNATEQVPTIGDIHALLPRNRAELRFGALLSINAGVVEELLFRLALPLLIFAVVGNAFAAVVASVLVFGLLHAYQGAPGLIASLVVGAILMAIFLLTGSILWPIIVHALFDLRSLVLIPVVVYRVHEK